MQFNEQYVADPAISQSDIKLFEQSIVAFHNSKILGLGESEQSDPMDVGSIIDAILLAPDELKRYYVVTDLKAKGKVKDVIDLVWQYCCNSPEVNLAEKMELKDYQDHIIKAIGICEYQTNWKLETRISKIISEGQNYFDQLQEARGLYMVSLESWNTAHNTVEDMKKDPITAQMLNWLTGIDIPEHIYIERQGELYGEYGKTRLKGRLDFFIVNTKEKAIEPWDLKSAKSHAQFRVNYRKHRYGRQGSFYSELIAQNYPDYKVKNFSFLVVPTERPKEEGAGFEYPEIYCMTDSEMALHKYGYDHPTGYRIKGWQELIMEIQWHVENGKFEHRKDYYEKGINLLETLAEPLVMDSGDAPALF